MIRLRWLANVIGLMALTVGTASAYDETPAKSVEKANGRTQVDDPYAHTYQNQEYTQSCVGRCVHWLMYKPVCDGTPCEAAYGPKCYPPLFTYFSCSPFNRNYKPYDGCICEKPSFRGMFCGWFGGRCRSCENEESCGSSCRSKGPWTISITFPGISISRGGDCCEASDACPAPKRERICALAPKCAAPCDPCPYNSCPVVKERCPILPRPFAGKVCDDSSATCTDGSCGDNCCRPRLFSGRLLGFLSTGCGVGSCGSCGYGKQCCSGQVHSPVDLEHLPIVAPSEIKDAKPGTLRYFKSSDAPPPAAPPPATESLPVPAKNQ
jgi:hypothetical protein